MPMRPMFEHSLAPEPAGLVNVQLTADQWAYRYRSTVTRVIDGDTVEASVDLGFRFTHNPVHLRLGGYNAPEMPKGSGPPDVNHPGVKARFALCEIVRRSANILYILTNRIVIQNFERYIAWSYALENDKLFNVAARMRADGHHEDPAHSPATVMRLADVPSGPEAVTTEMFDMYVDVYASDLSLFQKFMPKPFGMV